jgi:polysaccharide export outer membrane protein
MFPQGSFCLLFHHNQGSCAGSSGLLNGGSVPRVFPRGASWKRLAGNRQTLSAFLLGVWLLFSPGVSRSQTAPGTIERTSQGDKAETAEAYNRRLQQLRQSLAERTPAGQAVEYRIGAQDLLEINVFEAPELNRSLRVSAGGAISMPLLGEVQAAGLTAREFEGVLQSRLGEFMNNPHVGVFVSAIESHPVSVAGAVKKPGVFQIREPMTLIEMISRAEGLADDAGDTVLVMRGARFRPAADLGNARNEPGGARSSSAGELLQSPSAAPAKDDSNEKDTVRVNLKDLLESGDPRFDVAVHPGDVVKVPRAGIVYVVGAVKKPGGFVLKSNEKMTVLKAIALAEGLTGTSAKSRTQIIRTDASSGRRAEIPIDLGKILEERAPDPDLKAEDIVFVPNSPAKSALYRGSEAALAIISGVIIFHR